MLPAAPEEFVLFQSALDREESRVSRQERDLVELLVANRRREAAVRGSLPAYDPAPSAGPGTVPAANPDPEVPADPDAGEVATFQARLRQELPRLQRERRAAVAALDRVRARQQAVWNMLAVYGRPNRRKASPSGEPPEVSDQPRS
jgi:hypothetical protein